MAVNTVVQIIIGAINKTGTAFSSINKDLKNMGSGLDKAGKNLVSIGTKLTLLGAAPTAAMLGATKAAIDFESAFAGVRKTVDASEEEFQQLAQNFRDISKTTPLAVNELNAIGEIAGQLGVSGVENLTKFTKTIADIAISTNLTSELAATSFARIANIMQEPIDNIDKMGAATVDLGNNFATTEREIVNFATRIAGAGKIIGLTTADILGIGTAFSSVGVQAEAGGTAVQKVLLFMKQAASGSTAEFIDNTSAIGDNTEELGGLADKLKLAEIQQSEFSDKVKESTKIRKQSQIDKYKSKIAGLGSELDALNATQGKAVVSSSGFADVMNITNKEFKDLVKNDPSVAFEKFVNGLKRIEDEGGSAAGALEKLDIADQRLIRGFLSLANAGDLVNRAIETSSLAWDENTALLTEAEKRYATTQSQLILLKNNFNDVAITLGTVLLPPLNDLIQTLLPLIQRFSEFAMLHPNLVLGLTGVGIAIGILGVALVALGTIMSGVSALTTVLTTIIKNKLTVAIVNVGKQVVVTAIKFSVQLVKGLVAAGAQIVIFIAQMALAVAKMVFATAQALILGGANVLASLTRFAAAGWAVNSAWLAVAAVIAGVAATLKLISELSDKLFSKTSRFNIKSQIAGLEGITGIDIPGFGRATGGIVPGPIGEPALAKVHGGERITPAGLSQDQGGSGGAVTLNVNIGLYAGTETEKREIAKSLYSELVRAGIAENKDVKQLMGG